MSMILPRCASISINAGNWQMTVFAETRKAITIRDKKFQESGNLNYV